MVAIFGAIHVRVVMAFLSAVYAAATMWAEEVLLEARCVLGVLACPEVPAMLPEKVSQAHGLGHITTCEDVMGLVDDGLSLKKQAPPNNLEFVVNLYLNPSFRRQVES